MQISKITCIVFNTNKWTEKTICIFKYPSYLRRKGSGKWRILFVEHEASRMVASGFLKRQREETSGRPSWRSLQHPLSVQEWRCGGSWGDSEEGSAGGRQVGEETEDRGRLQQKTRGNCPQCGRSERLWALSCQPASLPNLQRNVLPHQCLRERLFIWKNEEPPEFCSKPVMGWGQKLSTGPSHICLTQLFQSFDFDLISTSKGIN